MLEREAGRGSKGPQLWLVLRGDGRPALTCALPAGQATDSAAEAPLQGLGLKSLATGSQSVCIKGATEGPSASDSENL